LQLQLSAFSIVFIKLIFSDVFLLFPTGAVRWIVFRSAWICYRGSWLLRGFLLICRWCRGISIRSIHINGHVQNVSVKQLVRMFIFKDLDFTKKAILVHCFIFETLLDFLTTYIDVFNFLAALAIHDITSKHEKFLSAQTDMSIQSLLFVYERMCTEVNKINIINRWVMLFAFVRALVLFTATIIFAIEESDWAMTALLLTHYTMYAMTFLLAADPNKKVNSTITRVQF